MERPRFVPFSTYRLQVHAGFPLDRGARHRALPSAAGDRRGLHLAVLRRGTGQSTHGYDITNHNELNREAGAPKRIPRSPTRSARPACSTWWTSCPTTWALARPPIPGGATCSRTDPTRRRRTSSTSTGTRSRPSCGASCCCRSSAISTGRSSSVASCTLQFDKDQLVARLLRSPPADQRAPCAGTGGPARSHAGRARRDPAEVQRDARPAEVVRRAARAARGAGLSPRLLAHRVARDQLPALLRRQHARRPARGGSRGLRVDPRTAGPAHRRGTGDRRADRSPGRAVRSGPLFRDAAGPRGRGLEDSRAPGAAPALRRRRKDPVGARTAAGRLGRPRHHRLQLSQPGQRAVRRAGQRAPDAPDLRQGHRRARRPSTTCSTRPSA